jgi:hypothetical protein
MRLACFVLALAMPMQPTLSMAEDLPTPVGPASITCGQFVRYHRNPAVQLVMLTWTAVSQDGQYYIALDTAFLYRKQLVTNCTCNGKNALGLASFDVKRDPTLRPGDIISTKEGLLAYTGRSQQGAAFTPVNPATLLVNIRPTSSQPRLAPSGEPIADDDPGTIVQPQRPLSTNPPSGR